VARALFSVVSEDVSQQETRQEHQSTCTDTQFSTHRARPYCTNRNRCQREAHPNGCSSTNQRGNQFNRSRHRMFPLPVDSVCSIHLDHRKVPPSGTRYYLQLVLSVGRSGTWAHSSTSFPLASLFPCLSLYSLSRFQVDEGSCLYFDPSPLLEYQKEDKQPPHVASQSLPPSSSHHHLNQRGQPFPMPGHHSANGVGLSPNVATPTRHVVPGQMGGPYPGPQFNTISPAQFYGERGSPMVTRGMGMGMGMGMDGMGITPDVRSLSRRV
jgi:hypothetical protein